MTPQLRGILSIGYWGFFSPPKKGRVVARTFQGKKGGTYISLFGREKFLVLEILGVEQWLESVSWFEVL